MKSLANANQVFYTYSPSAFLMTLKAKHIKEGAAVSVPEWGCGWGFVRWRRQCNLCGLEVILFMSKWACLFLSIVK